MKYANQLLIVILIFCSNVAFGQDAEFTGYATSIVADNEVAYSTYGFKDKGKVEPYDTTTVQPIGSVSKVVIGLAIMKAQELGLVNLDADINQYLNFKVINPRHKKYHKITLRQLATHTSGIKDTEKFYIQSYSKGLKSPNTLGDFLESYLTKEGGRYAKKNFGKYAPGEVYSYSNIGAALAAYVIECTSKMPFYQFTENHLFQPLGMSQTDWFYHEAQIEKYAQLFDEDDEPLDFYALATYPDGGLKTNIIDLSKLLQAIINGYQGNSDLLSKSSWDIFFTKNFSESNPVKEVDPSEPNSGIFIIYSKSGAIGHTGSDPGVVVVMFFQPETKKGKIFMANEDLTPQNLNSFKAIWENL